MKLILLQDIEKLGKTGDVITAARGYGRNFLVPKKMAIVYSDKAVKEFELRKKKEVKEKEKAKLGVLAMAERLKELSLSIAMESGVDDKLFGTVTPEKISYALANEGIHVDKKSITIEEQINKIGVYTVNVKLHPEVEAALRVWVVKK